MGVDETPQVKHPRRRDRRDQGRQERRVTIVLRILAAIIVLGSAGGVATGTYELAASMAYPKPPEKEIWYTVLSEDPEADLEVRGTWYREADNFIISVDHAEAEVDAEPVKIAVVVSESMANSTLRAQRPSLVEDGDHPKYILTAELNPGIAQDFGFHVGDDPDFILANSTAFHTAVHLPVFVSRDQFFNYDNPAADEACGCMIPSPGYPSFEEVLDDIAAGQEPLVDHIYNTVGFEQIAYQSLAQNHITSRIAYNSGGSAWFNQKLDAAYPDPTEGIATWELSGEHLFLNARATYTTLDATDQANQLYVLVGVLASIVVALSGLAIRIAIPRVPD